MGLRFRKSINLGGGFRINISKSGIGYSWGVKGFRVTKTAKGKIKTTTTIPGMGISYSKEVKPQNGTHSSAQKTLDKKGLNSKTKVFLLVMVFTIIFVMMLSVAGVKENSNLHDLVTAISEMSPIVLGALVVMIIGFACIIRYVLSDNEDAPEDANEDDLNDKNEMFICPNCGQPYEGYYCAACGTKTDSKDNKKHT